MKLTCIAYLLILSGTAYSQGSNNDSTRVIGVVQYKLDRLLDVYFYDFPACTTALDKGRIAIDSLHKALTAGQTLIDVRTEERDLKVTETETWQARHNNSEALHKQKEKQARKKGFRNGIIVGLGLGILGGLIR